MNFKWIRCFAATIIVSALLMACEPKESTPTVAPADTEQASTSLRFQALNVGRTINPDNTVTPQSLFSPDDKIIASITTNDAAKDVSVTARLIAMSNGQTLSELSRKITTTGPTTTDFEFSKSAPWPLGRYQVEAKIGDKTQALQEIDVREDGPPRSSEAESSQPSKVGVEDRKPE